MFFLIWYDSIRGMGRLIWLLHLASKCRIWLGNCISLPCSLAAGHFCHLLSSYPWLHNAVNKMLTAELSKKTQEYERIYILLHIYYLLLSYHLIVNFSDPKLGADFLVHRFNITQDFAVKSWETHCLACSTGQAQTFPQGLQNCRKRATREEL